MIEVHKKVKAVVFDLDGTLIDSAKQVLHIINFIRKKYLKKKKLSSNNIYRFLSIGGSKLIKQSLSLRKNEEIYLKIFRKIYLKKKFNKKIIYPNVLNFFKSLKKKKIKIIICTNKPSTQLKKIIKSCFFKKYINFYVTSDIVSCYKPNKVFIEYILLKTKLKRSDLLYIGDSIIDVRLCVKSNLNFLVYNNLFNDISATYLKKLKKKNLVFKNYNEIVV